MSETAAAIASSDNAKRQQILDGARAVFLEHGFDGASVNDVVRAAGVSKGTLYAYFPSKERLFETMVFEDRRRQAEQLFEFSPDGRAPREVLAELGFRLIRLMAQPESIAYARMVISASGKFPEAGRAYFAAGPMFGIAKLAAYFEALHAKGVLAVEDAKLAASQFIDLCASSSVKPMLFGFEVQVDEATLHQHANRAADLILKAYAAR